MTKIAIKLLSDSDLTFFECHFHAQDERSKQKAINLNADVFISEFFPNLKTSFDSIPFEISIIGPGEKQPYKLTRKALRSSGAKNWRLDGELIHNPDGDLDRYKPLRKRDFVILVFEGEDRPTFARLVFVSKQIDSSLHDSIAKQLSFDGRKTMLSVTEDFLRHLLSETQNNYTEHPLSFLSLYDTIEDVIQPQILIEDITAVQNNPDLT